MSRKKTYRAVYAFSVVEPGELELLSGDLIDVDEPIDTGEWGLGTNRRTQEKGSFPWTYVEICKTASNPHNLVQTASKKPAYCQHCEDFIWGSQGKQSYACSACGFRCHKKCKFSVENDSALECTPVPQSARPSPESENIENWSTEDVCIWLAAVNMGEYTTLFSDKSVDGKKLLTLTTPSRIGDIGIEDPFHKEMLTACLGELIRGECRLGEIDFPTRAAQPTDALDPLSFVDVCPRPVAGDKLLVIRNHPCRIKTFLNMCFCDSCHKPLWGVVHQGLQCTACGFITHRMCRDLVPFCEPKRIAVPPTTIRPALPANQPGFIFGMTLESQMCDQPAPPLMLQCFSAIEKSIKSSNLYRSTPSSAKARQLRSDISAKQVKLDSQDVHLLTAIVKRFFMELPEPLIPYTFYDKFINAVSQASTTVEMQVAELNTIVGQLPDVNRSTLTQLMQHLGRIAAASDSNKMDPNALATAWAPIVLYPPHDLLIFQFRNASLAMAAVSYLLSVCDCSGRPALKALAIPPRKPKPESKGGAGPTQYENITVAGQQPFYMSSSEVRAAPTPKPRAPKPSPGAGAAQPAAALTSYPWYGESMDRAAAEARLQDRPDGTFLVRPSLSHQGFSLSVKYGEIRHILISFAGGKYGFSEPLTFDSVIDLVENFQRTPLSAYNAELETTLRYPFKTAPKQQVVMEDSGVDDPLTEDVYIKNVSALRESLEQQSRQTHRTNFNDYSSAIKDKQRDVKAQEEIVTMFRDQKKLHESYRESLSDQDRQAVSSNYELLTSKLQMAESTLQRMQDDLQREKQKEDSQRNNGGADAGPAGGHQPVVSDDATFYVGNIERTEAERMLDGQLDGTFLVRLSVRNPSEPCTLSLRFGGVTRHIHIYWDGVRYGLAEPLSFNSLDSLCEYYKTEKLSGTITTTLKTPVKEVQGQARR